MFIVKNHLCEIINLLAISKIIIYISNFNYFSKKLCFNFDFNSLFINLNFPYCLGHLFNYYQYLACLSFENHYLFIL